MHCFYGKHFLYATNIFWSVDGSKNVCGIQKMFSIKTMHFSVSRNVFWVELHKNLLKKMHLKKILYFRSPRDWRGDNLGDMDGDILGDVWVLGDILPDFLLTFDIFDSRRDQFVFSFSGESATVVGEFSSFLLPLDLSLDGFSDESSSSSLIDRSGDGESISLSSELV